MTQRRPTGEVTGIRRAVNMIPAPPVVFELFFPTSAKISATWRRPVLSSDPKAARMISRNPVAGGLRHGRLALDVRQPQLVEYPDRPLGLLVVQRQIRHQGAARLQALEPGRASEGPRNGQWSSLLQSLSGSGVRAARSASAFLPSFSDFG